MKIGFSLGRCIRDIVRGDVKCDDVAFIIAATDIHDTEQLARVIEDYSYRNDYLAGLDLAECQRVGLLLWNCNRILQPRREGMRRHMQPANAVWVDMFPTVNTNNEAVKKAWDGYRFMLHMVENIDQDALETFK
jgi:hypothetical protein